MQASKNKGDEQLWKRRAKRTAIVVTLVCVIFGLIVYREALSYAMFWEGAVLGTLAVYVYSVLSVRYHRLLTVLAAIAGVGFLVAVMVGDIPPVQGSFRGFLGGLGLGGSLSNLVFVLRQD